MRQLVNPELQALLDRSFQLRAQAKHLTESATEIDAQAALLAPVKVGDVIPTRGISYKGKDMRITRVALIHTATLGTPKTIFRAWGNVLRKDGIEGATTTSAYWEIDGTEMEAPWL